MKQWSGFILTFFLLCIPNILRADIDWGSGITRILKGDGTPLTNGIAILLSVRSGSDLVNLNFLPVLPDIFTPGTPISERNNENLVLATADNFLSDGTLEISLIPDLTTSDLQSLGAEQGERLYLIVWDRDTFVDEKPVHGSELAVLPLFDDGNIQDPARTFGGTGLPFPPSVAIQDRNLSFRFVSTPWNPVGNSSFSSFLYPGWNLISFALDFEKSSDNTLQKVFGGKVNSPAWTWENNSFVQTETFRIRKGYWIYSREDERIPFNVRGRDVINPYRDIKKGWDLIGFPSAPGNSVEITRYDDVVWFWDAENKTFETTRSFLFALGHWVYWSGK